MEDQQSNPTEPEHSGIEMTSPQQPTKQVGSFPESSERTSTSSQRSSRESDGHQVVRNIPPMQDDAMHDIVTRRGMNRFPAASTSGQSTAQELPQLFHRNRHQVVRNVPPMQDDAMNDIATRRGINRFPAASTSVQSTAQELPRPSRRGILDFDTELTWDELYPVLQLERKYLSELLERERHEFDLEQSSLEQRGSEPSQYYRPRKFSLEDYRLPPGSKLEFCRFLSVIVIMSILSFGFFGFLVILWKYFS